MPVRLPRKVGNGWFTIGKRSVFHMMKGNVKLQVFISIFSCFPMKNHFIHLYLAATVWTCSPGFLHTVVLGFPLASFFVVVVVVLAAQDLCCCVQASCPVACGIFVPRPGIETASPALEGELLANGPPGKSWFLCLLTCVWYFGLVHFWFYPLDFSAIL